MKDAQEREIHWYEESNGGVVKEITENNVHNSKCEIITNNTMMEEHTIPQDSTMPLLKEEDSLNCTISPNKLESFEGSIEPPELCKEETTKDKEEEVQSSDHEEGSHHYRHRNDDMESHECHHHDMADGSNSLIQDSDYNNKALTDEQCVHSDAVKTGKTVKVNRVTPFRYADQESGNLLIDLTDSQVPDDTTYSKVKGKVEEKGFCSSFVEEVGISQERFTTDLPRHNWLVKRLKQQNQLNDGEDNNAPDPNSNYKPVKESKDSNGENENGHPSGPSSSEFKPIEVAQLPSLLPEHAHAQKEYDVLTVVPTSMLSSESSTTSDSGVHDTTTPITPTSPRKDDLSTTTTTTPVCSPSKVTSPPKSPCKTQDNVSPRSPVTTTFLPISPHKHNNNEPDIKPNSVTTSPVQKAPVLDGRKCPPPLSGIALSTLKYDSLSRFNSIPKHHMSSQFYPQVCESFSTVPPHNDVRMRDVSRPLPLHLQDGYKSEQDAYGINHRVRLSLTPLANTKDRLTYRNQIMDKSTAMMKSYDTLSSANIAASPEVLKRNAAIQRQLENQKRWIAEHEPYKLNVASSGGMYGDHNDGPGNNPAVASPLNPTAIPMQRYPSYRTDGGNNFAIDPASLLQSQEYLKDKIDACNKEIRDIQQQKDILFARQQTIPGNDSPTHLSIIALNRKLSSLEDYRMKQSALLMKLKTQYPCDDRGSSAMKKPPYVTMNGSSMDQEDLQAKQRSTVSEISENLLLRQLQSKHDESTGAATKTTDSHCRTIDLSKSSELFYNDVQMQNLRVSQPNTPMANMPMKDHLTAGDVPPLVSAERLSPASNNFPPRKSPLSPGDYQHSHSLPFSQPADVPRANNLTPSSQLPPPPPPPDAQRSHEIIHTFKSQETIMSRDLPRDIPPHHLQYQKIARARELQHSMQLQEMSRPPPHEMLHGAQFQDRHHPRLAPHDLNGSRPHTISHQEMKSREMTYSQMAGNEAMNNHYSPGGIPQNGPYPPDGSYEDIRSRQYSKDNLLKRHSTEPARPGQLKLARTSQNMMHQIHTSQMDKGFPKILQYNSTMNNRLVDNKFSPSNLPPGTMTTEGSPISPYQRAAYNRYEGITSNPPSSGPYEGGSMTSSYPPGDKKAIRVRTCNACDKESQFLCSGCRGIWYCSRQCQLDDWKVHSKTCRKK